ncbi:MAG: hypothetical protein QXT31_00240 [Candidatus Bathyarchaeia archaeon]
MKRILRVRISEKLFNTLKSYASEQCIPVSIIVRTAIYKFLKAEGVLASQNPDKKREEKTSEAKLLLIQKR